MNEWSPSRSLSSSPQALKILILWEVDNRPSFPRRDETRRSLPMSELTRSTLSRTEETLMNACVATTALSLVQRVFALIADRGRGAPSRATTTMNRDSRPSLTAYEKEGEKVRN
ncbi:unnamed protein product [Sphagnum balticum]